METTLSDSINELKCLSMQQLRTRYRELFEEEHTTRHRDVLIRRIAWRLQSAVAGGLSDRARDRARDLARDGDIRVLIPRTLTQTAHGSEHRSRRDHRLPEAGTIIRREYAGKVIEVAVLGDGFEHAGEHYASLSALATKVTGTRWNGFLFFGLTRRPLQKKAGR